MFACMRKSPEETEAAGSATRGGATLLVRRDLGVLRQQVTQLVHALHQAVAREGLDGELHAASIRQAQRSAGEVHRHFHAGESGSEQCREISPAESLATIDMGFWDEARLRQSGISQEVVANLFGSMQPGDITSPQRLEDGRYVIIKLTDRRLQTEPQTLETPGVRDQLAVLKEQAFGAVVHDNVVAIDAAKKK